MNDAVKIKIASAAVEAILFKGIPTAIKMLTNLNTKKRVTLEDIRRVRNELDSADYFKQEDKGVDAI